MASRQRLQELTDTITEQAIEMAEADDASPDDYAELEQRLVEKNREIQLLKIRNDYLEHKLERYEPKDDDEE
jgi:uncharacterized coiled-coil protein SlyX